MFVLPKELFWFVESGSDVFSIVELASIKASGVIRLRRMTEL